MRNIPFFGTYTNPYVQWVLLEDMRIWDETNDVLDDNPTYADTAIALTQNAYCYVWPAAVPSALPNGLYLVLLRDDATPAVSDEIKAYVIVAVEDGGLKIQGSRFQGI